MKRTIIGMAIGFLVGCVIAATGNLYYGTFVGNASQTTNNAGNPFVDATITNGLAPSSVTNLPAGQVISNLVVKSVFGILGGSITGTGGSFVITPGSSGFMIDNGSFGFGSTSVFIGPDGSGGILIQSGVGTGFDFSSSGTFTVLSGGSEYVTGGIYCNTGSETNVTTYSFIENNPVSYLPSFVGQANFSNSLISFSTNLALGSTSSMSSGYTNTTGQTQIVEYQTTTTISLVYYHRGGATGSTVCANPVWTNTGLVTWSGIVGYNCGIQVVSGVANCRGTNYSF